MIERSAQFRPPPALEFVAHRLRDELAAVLLAPVNFADEFVRQGNRYTFDGSHFILQV